MNVMVVEDNFLVGEMIRLAVEDASFDVVGPVATLDDGERLAANTELDGALLDIQLGSTKSFPIARLLRNKGVPFIFVSGTPTLSAPSFIVSFNEKSRSTAAICVVGATSEAGDVADCLDSLDRIESFVNSNATLPCIWDD